MTLDVRIPLENLPTETVQAILDDIVRGANGLAAFPTPPWRVAPLPDASARALNCPRPEPRHGDSLVRHHVHFDTQLSHDVLLNVMKEVSYPDSPPLRICTAHPSLLLVRILHRIQLEVDTVGYLSQVVRGVAPSHSLASQIATHEHRRNAQFFLLRLFVELVLDTGHDNPRNSDAVWYPRLVAAVPTCYSDFGQFRAMVHRWQPELLVEDATNWQLSLMGDNSLYHELAARNRSAFGHVLAWLDRGRVVEDGFEPLSYDPHHHRFQRPHDAVWPNLSNASIPLRHPRLT
ncbi:hypothetical protein JCM3766R1_000074 [Sporobolomyces carnicolor]